MNDLVKMSATEAVERLKTSEVSPLDLIDAALERIQEIDGTLNALPTLCIERAREHAKSLTDHPPTEIPRGFLYGLPVAIKDLIEVAGVRSTFGSPIYADNIPDQSDYLVETIENRGGVVLAKSNTPEFGAGGNTFNEVFGKTLNPWNTKMTCGGSSGGSAVALATGQIWLATGSDLGGSLRLPASFCSVVGLRPTPGRVATGPSELPFGSLSVDGPMGRNVADVALFLDAQTGRHPGDPKSLESPAKPFTEAVKTAKLPRRVAFSPDLGIAPVDGEIQDICAAGSRVFESLNATVDLATIDFDGAEETFQTLRAAQFVATYAPMLETHRDQLKPEVIWNIEKGLKLTADEISKAERARGKLYHRAAKFFEQYDLLVCPASSVPPFDVDLRYPTHIGDVELDNYIAWALITFAITLTASPAISVPCGFTKTGLPVGLQMVAPRGREDLLLSAAAAFEESIGLSPNIPIDPITKQSN